MTSPTKSSLPTPLFLPKGSVRALMALLPCLTLWYLVLIGQELSTALVDATTLVVILYFSFRTGMLAEGAPPPASPPLFLPRGSIRTILFLGFVIVGVSLICQGRPLPAVLSKIVAVLESYVLGIIVSAFVHRSAKERRPNPLVAVFRHGVALAAIGMTAFLCLTFIIGRPVWLPAFTQSLLSPAVAFYFGSRPGH